jgi:hypothetical protein
MRPASGVFQKRQHTLSARVLGCTKNGGFWRTALSPYKGNRLLASLFTTATQCVDYHAYRRVNQAFTTVLPHTTQGPEYRFPRGTLLDSL